MTNFTFEIYFNGQPVRAVAEETEVELRLANRGEDSLEGLELSLGREKLRAGISLAPSTTLIWPYRVQDLAGKLVFQVWHNGQTLSAASLDVYPKKISPAELEWLKYERLPRLLAQLDAPNTVLLTYGDRPDAPPFSYTSLDFTAQKLRGFSSQLLDGGLLEGLSQRLDYRVIEKARREEGMVRGNIRWNQTVQGWLNSPAETGLTHHWVEAPTDYATRPNLLLVFWLKELIYENRKLAWQVGTTGQASSQLEKAINEFKEYAGRFEYFLKNQKNLQPAQARPAAGFNPRDPVEWTEVVRDCRESFNPAYSRLAEAFEEYTCRYINLPEETGETAGIPPLSVIYEWWAACEIAAALGLSFKPGGQGRQSGLFGSETSVLYYNQAAPGGWYSAGRTQPARPDLRFEPGPQQGPDHRIFLDVKYRAAPGDPSRAHPEDMYRMLAYMNDFDVATGVIIFPGPTAVLPRVHLIEQPVILPGQGQGGQAKARMRLAELSLRPPSSNEPETVGRWEDSLKESLARLLEQL
jgi:hypothetical protein